MLPAAVPTLSRAGESQHLVSIPRHAHPPLGGGQDRAPQPWRSCKGSEPHATGEAADTWPPQQMWEQPVETSLCEGTAGTGAAPTCCPQQPSCTAQLGTAPARGGAARAGTGGTAGTAGSAKKQQGEMEKEQHPHHSTAPLLRKPVPQNDLGAHLPSHGH